MAHLSEAAVEALGGAIGSCIAFGITYPLTTISTWQSLDTQSASEDVQSGRSLLTKLVPSPLQQIYNCAKQPGGCGRLYAGLEPFLLGNVVSQGLYFYLYSTIRGWIVAARGAVSGPQAGPARAQDIGVLGSIIVASVAGAVNVVITAPLWTITTQQTNAARAGGPAAQISAWARAKEIYHKDGLPGLWSGVSASLLMVSNPTIQFLIYEWLITRTREIKQKRAAAAGSKATSQLSAGDAFVMSALAKLGATLATYPMQLIKSRMQARGAPGQEPYRSVWDAIVRILGTEGVAGLFKGMKAKMLQTVLGAALMMAIKEHVYNSIRALRVAASGPRAAALIASSIKA